MSMDQPLKMLVVDDSDDDRELCRRALGRAFGDRLRLVEATDGEGGLAAIETAGQDCVLLDYSLPGRNGIEVLKRIRSMQPHLPVILLTGQGNEAIAAQSIKDGAQDYIVKADITPDLLSRTIRAAIENSAHKKRHEEQNLMLAESYRNLNRLTKDVAQARDRAQQADRAKSRFLAGMSHELRTPLNGILGYAHMLRLEGGLNATQVGRVDAMLGAGNHLLGLIASVLDMSEIEAEHVTIHATEVDLTEIATECLEVVGAAAETKGLPLRLVAEPGAPPRLATDATRLRQVLLNLLGNAVKFTQRGSVELRLQPGADGSGVRIEVADTGPGIPPELRARLFQDFVRQDDRETAAIEGSGLGLALAARLAALLGGRIGQDDNFGGGSVFWLELPLAIAGVAPPIPAGAAAVPPAPPAPTRRLRVLVADDIDMNREIVRSFLKDIYDVTCVGGGAEAIAAAAGADYDVILMDVRMPEVDGLEATRRIRAFAGPRGQVNIVGLTAQVFADEVAACRKAGMDAHLAKPFSPDMLRQAVVRAAIARHADA